MIKSEVKKKYFILIEELSSERQKRDSKVLISSDLA